MVIFQERTYASLDRLTARVTARVPRHRQASTKMVR